MKKIALLTFHDTTNFGAMLQTFALYKKINDLGYECSILNYRNEGVYQAEIPKTFHFSLNPRDLAVELLIKSRYRRKYKDMRSFFDTNIKNVTPLYSREDLFHISEHFDTYIVGSDMLWALDLTKEDYSYFLDFVPEGISRCSFATSIGKEWTSEQLKHIKELVSGFKFVSVREDETAQKIRQLVNKECDVVCDPTMLLERTEWLPFVSTRYKGKKYVLIYFGNESGKNIQDAREYAAQNDLEVYFIGPAFSFRKREHRIFPTKIEDFLSLLYYADTVFTASYHGMLFALYFNKKLVYYNRHPAYRMQTAANRLGVEKLEGTSLEISEGIPYVDYEEVNANIEKFRNYSISRLELALQ